MQPFPMGCPQAMQAFRPDGYPLSMAALMSSSTAAHIPGEGFVSANQQSTTMGMPFNQGIVQGHPYPGAMNYTQQGAYISRSGHAHPIQLTYVPCCDIKPTLTYILRINDAAGRPPASYVGRPYHTDPSL
jgi:hypothetical protein